MRRTILILCLALIVGVCAAAQAAKVIQPPKTSLSYDFSSENKAGYTVAMADDWICPDGLPITGIRWWGSYWTPPMPGAYTPYSDTLNGATPGGITAFGIGIFANAPAGGSMPFDHPDTTAPLASWTVPYTATSETYAFTVTKSTSPTVVENVYEYTVDLSLAQPVSGFPAGAFRQQQGQKYWLVIGANFADPTRQWGWHEADGHWGSYATQSVGASLEGPVGWYIPCGGHDMAFELIVPEPGSICALAIGLTGLAGFAVRRRRL